MNSIDPKRPDLRRRCACSWIFRVAELSFDARNYPQLLAFMLVLRTGLRPLRMLELDYTESLTMGWGWNQRTDRYRIWIMDVITLRKNSLGTGLCLRLDQRIAIILNKSSLRETIGLIPSTWGWRHLSGKPSLPTQLDLEQGRFFRRFVNSNSICSAKLGS